MTVQELERQETIEHTPSAAPAVDATPVPRWVITFFAVARRLFGRPEDKRECVGEASDQSHVGTWNLKIIVTPDELDGGFIAEAVDIPGAASQGETQREALDNLIDAVQGVLAARMDEGLHASALDTTGDQFSITVNI